jgi:hypothetical protein
MEIRFNLEKEARKALVRAISEITGEKAVYMGAPSFAFKVGGYTVDRCGTIICGSGSADGVETLLGALAARGYVCDGREGNAPGSGSGESAREDGAAAAAEAGKSETALDNESGDDASVSCGMGMDSAAGIAGDRLTIGMPLSGFTPAAVSNLGRLVEAKAWILRKMTGAEELPVERRKDGLYFPWFSPDSSPAEADAYSRLIAGLCETAKAKRRVAARERLPEPGDNEKFKARCCLLALGFIGDEFAQARKILLEPFSGNGSHKTGNGKKAMAAVAGESDADEAFGGAPRDCLACGSSLSEPAPEGEPMSGCSAPSGRSMSKTANIAKRSTDGSEARK